jgi:hypothetical protein
MKRTRKRHCNENGCKLLSSRGRNTCLNHQAEASLVATQTWRRKVQDNVLAGIIHHSERPAVLAVPGIEDKELLKGCGSFLQEHQKNLGKLVECYCPAGSEPVGHESLPRHRYSTAQFYNKALLETACTRNGKKTTFPLRIKNLADAFNADNFLHAVSQEIIGLIHDKPRFIGAVNIAAIPLSVLISTLFDNHRYCHLP